MDIIKRSFAHSDCKLLTSLYVNLIRPLLEFAVPNLYHRYIVIRNFFKLSISPLYEKELIEEIQFKYFKSFML